MRSATYCWSDSGTGTPSLSPGKSEDRRNRDYNPSAMVIANLSSRAEMDFALEKHAAGWGHYIIFTTCMLFPWSYELGKGF
jgi:hypothetical protein